MFLCCLRSIMRPLSSCRNSFAATPKPRRSVIAFVRNNAYYKSFMFVLCVIRFLPPLPLFLERSGCSHPSTDVSCSLASGRLGGAQTRRSTRSGLDGVGGRGLDGGLQWTSGAVNDSPSPGRAQCVISAYLQLGNTHLR